MYWQIRDRQLSFEKTLIMGVLNITPDSFSDGGKFLAAKDALKRSEQMIDEGADIIDIGGESSRPGSKPVEARKEISRVVPIIEAVVKHFDIPVSVDTYKASVARAAVNSGAAIVNDISAFRFDAAMPGVIAEVNAGAVLMHSRGSFETLHSTAPADDIFEDIRCDFLRAINTARAAGIADEAIALDVGIGFGKTLDQNLALISGVGRLISQFPKYAFLIGTSRKSFIGKVLDGVSVDRRLEGSLATAVIAARSGVRIVRTHDIKETAAALKIVDALTCH
jgi:dihydropteroate synthase